MRKRIKPHLVKDKQLYLRKITPELHVERETLSDRRKEQGAIKGGGTSDRDKIVHTFNSNFWICLFSTHKSMANNGYYYYGKTPWWRILIQLRKAFVVFNAIIGILTVLNITGFSMENFMASCYMMGVTYFEMFSLGIGRIFSWFYNLFDKITPYPSVPSNPPSKPKFYKIPYISTGEIPPKPSYPNLGPSSVSWTVEDFLNPKKNESSGWNMPSWVWYAAIAALTIGAAYLGYQVVTSDQFRDWLSPHHKNTNTGSLDPSTVPLPPSPRGFDTPYHILVDYFLQ